MRAGVALFALTAAVVARMESMVTCLVAVGLGAAGQERPAPGAGDFGLQADDARHGSLEKAGIGARGSGSAAPIGSNGGTSRFATPASFSAVGFGCRIVPEALSPQSSPTSSRSVVP